MSHKKLNKKLVDELQMSPRAEHWVGIVEQPGTGRQNLGQRNNFIAARIECE